jgi:membrane protein DedA with SNARE-associated domain/rhodanese-related sulfurtransferase
MMTIERHLILIVFLNTLVTQSGLPIPVLPVLVAASGLADRNPGKILEIGAAAFAGAVLGDMACYSYGRRYGRKVLGFLCKLSFSPDFCVQQTETMFEKTGFISILFAKFIPGLSLISNAMAGARAVPVSLFLLLDAFGTVLFIGVAVSIGRLLQHSIAYLASEIEALGTIGAAIVVAAIMLFVAVKWLRRKMFIRQLRMQRITVPELHQLLTAARIVVLDVRPPDIRAQYGIIPGALPAHTTEIEHLAVRYDREQEIAIYCDCPNEASAATAALHLKRAGFRKIRPLLGGTAAWIAAGLPLERGDSGSGIAPCIQAPLS